MPRPRKAVSQKQLAANRANAAKSTGPRTPQGKARSSQNARKHGFTASTFAVVRLEDLDEIAHLRADLIAVYQPVNSQELFAIERLALTQQAILRAARLESGLFTTCLNEALDPCLGAVVFMAPELSGNGDIEISRAQNRNHALGEGFHRLVKHSNSWSLALRYQAQAERHYRRAVEEFDRLKALRPELPNEPGFDPQPEPKETTCTPTNEPVPPAAPSSQSLPKPASGPACRPAHENYAAPHLVGQAVAPVLRGLPRSFGSTHLPDTTPAGGNAALSDSSYNRVVKSIALAVLSGLLLMAGCNRTAENPEAVRTAILEYLSSQKGLNVAAMQVDVTALTFRQNEADATVAFRAKGTSGGSGMTFRYTLERKGNAWVVKGKAESGGTPHGATGPAGAMPGAMPGAAPGAMPGAMPSGMPSGHPDMGAKPPAETKK